MTEKTYEMSKKIALTEPRNIDITQTKTSYFSLQNEEFTINFGDLGYTPTQIYLYSVGVDNDAPKLEAIKTTNTSATFICDVTGVWGKYYLFERDNNHISDYFTLMVTPTNEGQSRAPVISTIKDINMKVSQTVGVVYAAMDSDSTIVKHEFSDNNGSSFSVIKPSTIGGEYTHYVSYSTAGRRSCQIRVTNGNGETATTPTFYINVTDDGSSGGGGGSTDNPPIVYTSGDIDTKVSQNFTILYTARDDKGIDKHEFSDNNGSSYTRIYPIKDGDNYRYNMEYPTSGTRSCKIRVTDTKGQATTTSTFYIRVTSSDSGGSGGGEITDKPPTISPIGDINTKVSQRFTIYYNANDDKGINKHEFSDNNGSSYSIIYPDGSLGSYSYSKSYSSTGTRSCKIRVTDTKGQTATSPTFYISINNSDSGTKPPSTGVKSELYNAKVAFDDSHSNLKNVINSIIADGRYDEATEKNRLDNAFSSYRDALSHYSKVHQKALDNINENAKKEAENNSMEHTNNKFSILAQDMDGFKMQVSREYATKNEMSTVEQKADKINWIVQSGTSQSNMTLTPELFSIIANNLVLRGKQIEITGDTIITGLVTANEYFVIKEDGSVESKDLSVSNVISANSIVGQYLTVPWFDTSLTQNITVYINSSYSYPSQYYDELDSTYLEDGVTFRSFSDLFGVCPKNLNGYKLTIKLSTDIYEVVDIDGFGNGTIEMHMSGHSLNGCIKVEGSNSLIFKLYGNTDKNTGGTYGNIKPSSGYLHDNFRFCLLIKNANSYIYDMNFYKGKASDYPNNCIGIAEESKSYVKNAVAVNTPNNLIRVSETSHAYVESSKGVTSSTPFQAVEGSILHLNDVKQTGRSGGTTKTYAANNSQIYATGVTWDTVEQTGNNGNTDSNTSATKTVTIKSIEGRSYRTSGNYSGTWSSDAVVRQGRWTSALGSNTGYWFFGSALKNILNSKNKIESVKIKVTRQSGGVHGNVTHYLRCHKHTSKPSSSPSQLSTSVLNKSFTLSTGQSLVINLSSSEISNLVNNGVCGFGLYTSSTSQSGYSCCSANLSVTITYKTS